jgi:RecB family endonuclease NucS
LCEDDNLEKLSNTIDVTLTDPKPEERLVDKICDIVCRDDNDDIVIIENQFGKSNHDHLGKLITYMSGKNAKKAIWIVGGDVSEDHISAIQ